MSLSIQRNSVIFIILIILFPIINLFGGGILDYYDEVLGVIVFIAVMNWYIQKRLDYSDSLMVNILAVITVIGIISNLFSGAVSNLFIIAVDALWFWKTFALYIFFKMISSSEDRRAGILDVLVPIAKVTIIFITLCSIVGIFADMGVAGGSTVNGIRQFAFFWGNTIQTGWLMFSCLCLIANDKNEKCFVKYLAISCIPAILSFSALVYCWFFVAVHLTIFLREDNKIKPWNIVVLAIGAIAFLFADVSEYLLSESIRSTFWKAAFKLANQYFPLGTGFASFGSDMAARYYSPIYVELGWSGTWGLGQGSGYLNDNFFASILGQFGWIGFILYLTVLVIMFFYVNRYSTGKYERVSTVASVLTIAAVMVGSASAKSMMGCCMFAVLGIIMGKENSSNSELEEVYEE